MEPAEVAIAAYLGKEVVGFSNPNSILVFIAIHICKMYVKQSVQLIPITL